MGIFDIFMKNVRMPQGFIGRLMARGMNKTHHMRTNWGLQHVTIQGDYTILDIGCGGGRTIRKLADKAPNGKIYGIDISKDSVEVAKNHNRKLISNGKVDIRVSGVSDIPFMADAFDLITAVETHYYWPHFETDLGEVLRVLKPGGVFLVVGGEYLGSRFDDRNISWANTIGMRLHTLDEFNDILVGVGFVNVDVLEDNKNGWFCATAEKNIEK